MSRAMRKRSRLSRVRKKWLQRHVPLGIVMDPVVIGNPERQWGRDSFIAEKGHGKKTWSDLWKIWNPGALPMWKTGRFIRGPGWIAGKEPRLPKRLRRAA